MTDSCTSLRPKTFDEFCMDLLRATDRCIPLRDQKYYTGVSVLAFHWENDDIGIRAQERELLELFRSDYGFYVESISIPLTAQATLSLAWRLAAFTLKHGSPARLIIFVYSGYAEWLNGSLVLSGCRANAGPGKIEEGPTINWTQIQSLCEASAGQVLYLMNTAFPVPVSAYQGSEVLAAASKAGGATMPQASFMRMLVDELKMSTGASSVSVAQLYALLRRRVAATTTTTTTGHTQQSPVHISKSGKPSIVISKLGLFTKPNAELYTARDNGLEPVVHQAALVSINLSHEIGDPQLEYWKQWLASHIPTPLLSSRISMEAVFGGGSSVILVALPLEVWTVLEMEDCAYRFVSLVRSHNKVPRRCCSRSSLCSKCST